MRRYLAPAGRICHRGDRPRPITRCSCGTWHRANAAGTSCPAWPRCPPCCAGRPSRRPRSRQMRMPQRTSAMPGRRCWAGRSAGWRRRLGAAPGLAPFQDGRIRDRPGDRENRRGHRARQRRGVHAVLVCPGYRGQVELHRQLRPALATGDRARDGGRGRDRRRRLDHAPGRLAPGAARPCGCRKSMPPGDIHESRPRRGHVAEPGNRPGQ